ncbi:unnamed protein product [Durusdinium trenchii]|uniref:Uncharacterized protein n=1 Tax=Durusdinium trenchii TaxID=1381693 RepID=A0ABP0RMQ0_9DINO
MELNGVGKTQKLLLEDESDQATKATPAGGSGEQEASVSAENALVGPPPRRRVASVKITAGGAIDRVEFRYEDGSKWSLGGPGGDKGIPPLVLAEDEYLEEVRHESLPQWWYVGSAIEFRTNKGKLFRHVAHFGSGEDEDMVTFRARPGKCITRLHFHDGELKGIVEEDCHVPEGTELEMFMTYWTDPEGSARESREVKCPKGHIMRKDWSRTGHICDECSRRGTAARCGGGCDYDLCEMCFKHHMEGWASEVQRRGFASRDAAMSFASRHGAPVGGALLLGPIRLEMEDHPWLDGYRELREACGSWTRRLSSLVQQARNADTGPRLPTFDPRAPRTARAPAGLVVDVRRGTRIRAWGPPERLAMCEKAAVDAGEFNASQWSKKSSSFRGFVSWIRRTIPLAWRVLSLLDWRRNVWSSLAVGLCIIIRSACDAWQPVLTGAVFNLVNGDRHEVERESHFLHFLCSWTFGCSGRLPLARSVILGLMLAAIVQGLARVVGDGIKKAMKDQQNTEMRIAMFEHLLSQDQALYDTLRQRDLVQKVELRAMSEVTEWVWQMAADTVKLATQLVFLFAISPLMTLAYTVLLPLMEQTIRRYCEQSLRAKQRRENGLQHISSGVVQEAVWMIRTVKCFSREDKHVALVSLAASGMAKADVSDSKLKGVKHGLAKLLPDISQRSVYCFCLWCGLVWMERDFSAGDMTAYLLLVQQVGGLVQRVRNQFLELQRRHDMLLDHFEFMDRSPHLVSGTHEAQVEGDVQFRAVEFSYPARPDVQVLRGVSFSMEKAQMTALVGASGSGKSTIAALLFRHYDPSVGEILVDGVPLSDWETSALHAQMALVAQQPLLFDTSVRNNLTYGCRRDVSDEEIEAAARLASAHDFVVKFPAGYDTYVGDQGAHMSGGQKQRLSIARAVILKPRILVLDEATSALDAEAEGAVQDALDTVMVGRTTLVIAHRLSTIRNAHRIVCMRDGLVVECGTPKELLAKQGYYWNLVKRQVCTLDDLQGFNLELDQHPAEESQVEGKKAEAVEENGKLDEAKPTTAGTEEES